MPELTPAWLNWKSLALLKSCLIAPMANHPDVAKKKKKKKSTHTAGRGRPSLFSEHARELSPQEGDIIFYQSRSTSTSCSNLFKFVKNVDSATLFCCEGTVLCSVLYHKEENKTKVFLFPGVITLLSTKFFRFLLRVSIKKLYQEYDIIKKIFIIWYIKMS